jgi:FIMAH domain
VHGVGPSTSLGDKLKQAQNYLAANDVADTCATLTAFINQLEAQTGKSIPAVTANTLISQATHIETLLGC